MNRDQQESICSIVGDEQVLVQFFAIDAVQVLLFCSHLEMATGADAAVTALPYTEKVHPLSADDALLDRVHFN